MEQLEQLKYRQLKMLCSAYGQNLVANTLGVRQETVSRWSNHKIKIGRKARANINILFWNNFKYDPEENHWFSSQPLKELKEIFYEKS